MEPQLNHNDIHMEKNDKEAIECWTRFGTDLSESTPPPGGSSTVALWRITAAWYCFGALDKWTTVVVGTLGHRPTENEDNVVQMDN